MHQARSPRTLDTETAEGATASRGNAGGPGRGRIVALVLVLVTAVVVGLVGFSLGRLSTLNDPAPSNTSAEAGFSRDMQVHHNQGVELSLLVRDRTDDPDVRLLAFDIATTQGQQSGQMYGWLSLWDLPKLASEPSMTWMTRPGRSGEGHAHSVTHVPGEPMPGLATSEQIASLTDASGVEAERIYLELMIAHHQGAVEMAEGLLDRSDHSVVRAFATSVVASQSAEIELMESLLAERS